MRRGVLCSFFAMALIAFFCAPQLRADGIATFTYTDPTLALTVVWTLPEHPSTDPTFSPDSSDGLFSISSATPADTFVFFNSSSNAAPGYPNGGLIDFLGLYLTTPGGDQFFKGDVSNPTFVPMAFYGDVTNNLIGDTGGTLVITTPEPSVLLLLFAGLCALLIVSFRGRPSV
jgi:hypothetical protein